MAGSQHCVLGETGENLACAELRRRGYAILDRRYRTAAGEIDIVARDGDALVFVEVKTRASPRRGRAAEAVAAAKRRQIVAMAGDWLARHRVRARGCRFDVVAVDYDERGRPQVVVLPAAFMAGE